MSVSVLIPALNEGDDLRRTFECARATVPDATEIIVVDDGSTDGCADFLRVRAAAATLMGPQVPGRRLGAAGARNRAASAARGDVLVFIDAHVDLSAGWLDRLLQTLAEPGIGAVAPGIAVRGEPGSIGYGLRWRSAALNVEWLPVAGSLPYAVPLLPGACIAIRRDVFFACGGFDRSLVQWGSEDAELSLRLWRLGYDLRIVPAVSVGHLFRERHPYAVDWTSVLHNLLRVAFIHFTAPRLARVLETIKGYDDFAVAMARLAAGDAWRQRAFMEQFATRDDDAYFERFGDI